MKVFCYEDRATDEVGVKLLVLSLQRYCPGLDVEVTFPNAPPELMGWFAARPGASLRMDWSGGPQRRGWNVKPHLLLRALEQGVREAVWIDSDVLLTADFRPLISGIGEETLVVSEEYLNARLQGGTARTTDWQLEVGRALPCTVNTGILRVTRSHRALLESWDELMLSDRYQQAQQKIWSDRPLSMLGDQDVLTALLGSQRFADTPIHWVRRGTEIAQCFHHGGYLAHERFRNLARGTTPVFLHSVGVKPWRAEPTLHAQLSPYTIAAAEYAQDLGAEIGWAKPRTTAARVLRGFSGGGRNAAGLLPSIAHELRYQFVATAWIKKMFGLR